MVQSIGFDNKDFFDFQLLGIQRISITDLAMIYHLNKLSQTRFHRVEDLDLKKKHNTYFFSMYSFCYPKLQNEFYLIKNQSHNHFESNENNDFNQLFPTRIHLIPELQIYDYFIKSYVQHDQNPLLQLSLTGNQRQIRITALDLNLISSKENLIF